MFSSQITYDISVLMEALHRDTGVKVFEFDYATVFKCYVLDFVMSYATELYDDICNYYVNVFHRLQFTEPSPGLIDVEIEALEEKEYKILRQPVLFDFVDETISEHFD